MVLPTLPRLKYTDLTFSIYYLYMTLIWSERSLFVTEIFGSYWIEKASGLSNCADFGHPGTYLSETDLAATQRYFLRDNVQEE